MTIEKFEVGKSYRWVGKRTLPDVWSDAMSFLLDGKPHKVVKINCHGQGAAFEDDPVSDEYCWSFCSTIQDFEEVHKHHMRPTHEDIEWFIMFIVLILFLIVLFRLTVVGG